MNVTKLLLPLASPWRTSASSLRQCLSTTAEPALRMSSIGKMHATLTTGDYAAGQCFIHRAFAYRGVVLFPWTTEVHCRSDQSPTSKQHTDSQFMRKFVDGTTTPLAVAPKTQTYYQVLIHADDWAHARLESDQPTVITLSREHLELPTAQGIDNVCHDEIIPYDSTEDPLIDHKLFYYLFSQQQVSPTDHKWTGTDYLRKWHAAQKAALDASNVYTSTTGDIKVTVIPYFVGAHQRFDVTEYWWRYSIRVELLGEGTAIVRQRELRVYTSDGKTNVDNGRGLHAQTEPQLTHRRRVYQAMTHVKLKAQTGNAWGTMTVERWLPHSTQSTIVKVNIPTFHLEAVTNSSTGDVS